MRCGGVDHDEEDLVGHCLSISGELLRLAAGPRLALTLLLVNGLARRTVPMRVPHSAWLAILGFAVVACGSPTQPTDGFVPDFIVATGMNVVPVGGTLRFTVTAYARSSERNAYITGAKQSEDVSRFARWSSDDPAVAGVRSTDIVGRAAGTTNVRASYMDRQYAIPVYVVAPGPSVQQFAGTWSGAAKRSCQDLIGNTRSCYPLCSGQPCVSSIPVSMTLMDVGGVLQGTVDMGGSGGWSRLTGPVAGGVHTDGELVIGGTLRLADHGHDSALQLRDWRFAWAGGHLSGSGTSDSGFVNIYGVVWQRVTYTEILLR